jgi:hypothetical protein
MMHPVRVDTMLAECGKRYVRVSDPDCLVERQHRSQRKQTRGEED